MAAERVVVREISWRDVVPWLIIFRTFGLAISLPVLFLATMGAVMSPIGWQLSEACFAPETSGVHREFAQVVAANGCWPHKPTPPLVPNDGRFPTSVSEVLSTQPNVVEPVFRRFVDPVARLFTSQLTWRQAGYYALGTLWMLVIWGFYGGAITRMAVVRLGREEQISLGEAMRFTRARLGSYIGSPLFLLFGVCLLGLPSYLLGLLMQLNVGVPVAGVLWVVVLLCALAMTVLLLGLLFGWPLMWGVISSQQYGDAFEAVSRSYSYAFGRPLHYLFYAILATVFGALGWLLVYHVSEFVILMSRLPASLGTGPDRWAELLAGMEEPSLTGSAVGVGTWLIGSLESVVRTVASAFGYSFFWCLAAAIYLLLRRDVDQTEFDEVFLENENRRYELPELKPMVATGAAPTGSTPPPDEGSRDASPSDS